MADGLLREKGGGGSLRRLLVAPNVGVHSRLSFHGFVASSVMFSLQIHGMASDRGSERVVELGGAGNGVAGAQFVADDSVRYTPAGTKLKAIEAISESRGYRLVGPRAR